MAAAAIPIDPALAGAGTARAGAPVIEVDGLCRRFGPVEALRGVDVEVAAGEVHGLLGPNGAGKTTLMRILCGLVDPTAGDAYVLDRRAGRSRDLRAMIGIVPPGDRSFYLRLSGVENLVFFARLEGLRKRAARGRALELLGEVGLQDAGDRPVNTYSHGMQKRLSFARARLGEPRLLLVDEANVAPCRPVPASCIRQPDWPSSGRWDRGCSASRPGAALPKSHEEGTATFAHYDAAQLPRITGEGKTSAHRHGRPLRAQLAGRVPAPQLLRRSRAGAGCRAAARCRLRRARNLHRVG